MISVRGTGWGQEGEEIMDFPPPLLGARGDVSEKSELLVAGDGGGGKPLVKIHACVTSMS